MAQSRSTVGIWAFSVDNWGRFCGRGGQFRWNQKNVPRSPCAPPPGGHRTSLTPSGNGRRDSSETRVLTRANRLAGERSRRRDDDAAGTGDDGQSIGSVIGTDQPKGPWDSYSRGPFTYFRSEGLPVPTICGPCCDGAMSRGPSPRPSSCPSPFWRWARPSGHLAGGPTRDQVVALTIFGPLFPGSSSSRALQRIVQPSGPDDI